MTWLLLAGAVLAEVGGTLSLRMASTGGDRRWYVPLVLGYVLAFSLISGALSLGMPLGVAYGVWVAVGIVLILAPLVTSRWGADRSAPPATHRVATLAACAVLLFLSLGRITLNDFHPFLYFR